MLYEYQCRVCGKIFEEFRSVAERHNVVHCDVRATKLISQVNADPDLYMQGTTEIFGKPVEIRSKSHFRQMLREHNMVDASPSECLREGKIKKKSVEVSRSNQRRKKAEKLAKTISKDGLVKPAKQIISKILNQGGK